jgi:VIT1/CCC1 family predicted Fe2+/Mn2+ transporter
VVSGLLIIALADNISDSLSIHIYQESEGLESRAAFRATILNFGARLLVASSFVGIVLVCSPAVAMMVAILWGTFLLAAITHGVARLRGVSPWREMSKHIFVALLVIAVSRVLGGWIAAHVH